MKRWKQVVAVAGGVCLLAGLVLVPATVSANPDNIITLNFPYATVDEDAQFSIQVLIDNIVNFDATQYNVHFDPAVLQLDTVSTGSINATTIPVTFCLEVEGVNSGNWTVLQNVPDTPGVTGGGYFSELNFTVIGSDATSSIIYLDNGMVSDNAANEIVCNWTGATDSVTVDLLQVELISVVGEESTNEGYKAPHQVDGCITETNFTMTPTVSGGTGAGTYTYAWSFGTDGLGSTTAPAPGDVQYSSTVNKTVTLRVTDALASTSEGYEASGTAVVWDTLVADFSGDTGTTDYPQKGVVKWDSTQWVSTTHAPSTVDFTSSVTGGKTDAAYTHYWDFNNDTTADSSAADPSFDFATFAGTDTGFIGANYTVEKTVSDALTAVDDNIKAGYITIYVSGDVNGTGGPTAADITAIERIVVGMDPPTLTSDVNDDGVVNVLDITATELAVL